MVHRRPDWLKILWWDRSGYYLLYDRLETGTVPMPRLSDRVTKLTGKKA